MTSSSTDEVDRWLSERMLVPSERFGIHEPVPGWSWRPRLGDYDIWMVLQGRGEARIGTRSPVGLSAGSVLVLRPGDSGWVGQDESGPVRVAFCHFGIWDPGPRTSVRFPEHLAPPPFQQVDPAGRPASLLTSLIRILSSPAAMQRVRTRATLAQLVAALYALPDRASGTLGEAALVRRAAAVIDADPAARHSLEQVAGAVGVPPRQLAPLFRRQLGMSFREYVLESRLRRARILVGETDISITRIARLLGYPDHCLLSNQFRARFGCSPRDYRSFTTPSATLEPSSEAVESV